MKSLYLYPHQIIYRMQQEDELSRLRQLNNSKQIIQVEHNLEPQPEKSEKKPASEQEASQGSQSGHTHGQHCSHGSKSKGKDKDKNKHKHRSRGKNYGIIIYCVFTCLSCLYLEVYCFHTLEPNQHIRWVKSFFTCLVVFMALWSYFQTIRTQNTMPKLKGLPNVIRDPMIDSDYLSRECQHCKYPKPARVSHCSTCGHCIMKLDHHCMWTQNCIGYRNQRPFYLFTLYMSIGLAQYWTATYAAFTTMYGTCKFFSYFEPGVYILWIITCFSASVVGMMIVALLVSHTMMILTNHTTLMSMKFKRMCPIPFIQFREQILQDQYINAYDRGEIQNIRSLFGTNILLAFLPLTRQPYHDFLFEPPNPAPTKGQITALMGGGEAEFEREEEVRRSMLRLKELYRGQKYLFNGEIIQVK